MATHRHSSTQVPAAHPLGGGPAPAQGTGAADRAVSGRPLWGPVRRLLAAFARWWVVDEPLEQADAIVVLGGDTIDGERIRHAVEIYQQGWAPQIVLSGPYLRSYLHETELMEREAGELGVPPHALLLARHNADSTLEEALTLRDFLRRNGLQHVIVSTSDFHTRRARSAFRAVLEPAGIRLRMSAAPSGRFPIEQWWRERVGLSTFVLELLKTINDRWELRRHRRHARRAPHPEGPPALLPGPSRRS